MKYKEYNHRHGKELLKLLHPKALQEITGLLKKLAPYDHGKVKGKTVKEFITPEFVAIGWEPEARADFGTDKSDLLDLAKWKVAIEMEFSRFEAFFRDFFRFMLLYERRVIDVGIIITLDEMAYQRWGRGVKSYKGARASLQRLEDFLKGDYGSIVGVPLWCIGIE